MNRLHLHLGALLIAFVVMLLTIGVPRQDYADYNAKKAKLSAVIEASLHIKN